MSSFACCPGHSLLSVPSWEGGGVGCGKPWMGLWLQARFEDSIIITEASVLRHPGGFPRSGPDARGHLMLWESPPCPAAWGIHFLSPWKPGFRCLFFCSPNPAEPGLGNGREASRTGTKGLRTEWSTAGWWSWMLREGCEGGTPKGLMSL